MLLGTQWYLLFNVIAGRDRDPAGAARHHCAAAPVALGALAHVAVAGPVPVLVTGAITAVGGAWNASIVAEYVEFAGNTYSTVGIGATIARGDRARRLRAAAGGDVAMVLAVVLINRLFWLPAVPAGRGALPYGVAMDAAASPRAPSRCSSSPASPRPMARRRGRFYALRDID